MSKLQLLERQLAYAQSKQASTASSTGQPETPVQDQILIITRAYHELEAQVDSLKQELEKARAETERQVERNNAVLAEREQLTARLQVAEQERKAERSEMKEELTKLQNALRSAQQDTETERTQRLAAEVQLAGLKENYQSAQKMLETARKPVPAAKGRAPAPKPVSPRSFTMAINRRADGLMASVVVTPTT